MNRADEFLPVTPHEAALRGWDELDFVYVCGDAYVDHSSFGAAIITRLLESRGYRVGIIPQPDWTRPESIAVFGAPRLAFLVSSGNMDSMVNHYSVSRHRRDRDAYSPGGETGLRPDRACIVYSNLIRRTYKKTPIILGGIEASLRRLAHYDYWSDSLRRSILLDAGADLISYGMGERSILEIAQALNAGIPVSELSFIPGTVYRTKDLKRASDPVILPSFETLQAEKTAYARSFALQYKNTDPFTARVLTEDYGSRGFVVQNPPAKPLSQQEMDDIYELPYTGRYHPMYESRGGIPALEEVAFSLTSTRGCFGGCSFCALTFHQGRIVQCRSHESLLREAAALTKREDFKGYIHDVGGPTADFRGPSCKKQLTKGVCSDRQCLFPRPCRNLTVDHEDYRLLLKKLRELPGVKKVFVRSGIRFDYLCADPDRRFLKDLVRWHVSGQLRVAPEHVSDRVLFYMGKPEHAVYERFLKAFTRESLSCGRKQYAVPYFMSSHPGCRMEDAVALAEYIRDMGFVPEQVQDFYPTPSTLSTCMYYTGVHPLTGEPVYIPKSPHEKAVQRALLQYRDPKLRPLVLEGLRMAGRMDLVGYGPKCLIRPEEKERRAGKTRSVEKKGRTARKQAPVQSGGLRSKKYQGDKHDADPVRKQKKGRTGLHSR